MDRALRKIASDGRETGPFPGCPMDVRLKATQVEDEGTPLREPRPKEMASMNMRLLERSSRCCAALAGRSMLLFTLLGAASQAGAAMPLEPGDHQRTATANGQTRAYLVHIPHGGLDEPAPVVLALHGAGINAQVMVRLSGLNAKSDEAGFVAVYPNGSGLGDWVLTWNAGGFPEKIAERKPDDVAFIEAVLDDLGAVVPVDPKRVYATGLSNGAMMCYRLAAELSGRIAAIAPVSGTLALDQWAPDRPVPVLHFHGTADRIVPFGGPGENMRKLLAFKSVADTIRLCREANHCSVEPETVQIPDTIDDGTTVVRSTYAPEDTGAEVVLYTIENGGHTWPGQSPPNRFLGKSTKDVAANDVIWDFFKRHQLP